MPSRHYFRTAPALSRPGANQASVFAALPNRLLQSLRPQESDAGRHTAEWCNGSTTDSESVSLGSNPSSAARARRIRLAAQDAALSRRRSRVRIPYAPPTFQIRISPPATDNCVHGAYQLWPFCGHLLRLNGDPGERASDLPLALPNRCLQTSVSL